MSCFWCAGVRLGGTYYDWCAGCLERRGEGVALVEVMCDSDEQVVHAGLRYGEEVVYPTGVWAVVPNGWVERRLPGIWQHAEVGAVVFVDPGTWDALELPRPVVTKRRRRATSRA